MLILWSQGWGVLKPEYIKTRVFTNKDLSYNPICIELSANQSIEDLLFQLNDIILTYTKDQILLLCASDKKDKVQCVVALLNELYVKLDSVIIKDDGNCVLSNGYLSDWFKDIIENENLTKRLCLYIASRHNLNVVAKAKYTQVISVELKPLAKRDSRVLLRSYAEIQGVVLDDQIESYILNNIPGIPSIIFKCIEIVKHNNVKSSEQQITQLKKNEEDNYMSIINIIKEDDVSYQILILLSYFDFVSYDIINEMLADLVEDIDERLQFIYSYLLFEQFGSNNQYIKVNPVVSDYISRHKLVLNTNFNNALKDVIRKFIANGGEDSVKEYDLSGYLCGIQQSIRKNISNINRKYLIPSFTLKAIIEEYKSGNDKNVILLSGRFLETNINYYDEIVSTIKYWRLSALCRLQYEQIFFDEIGDFKSKYRREFLLGFYYRHARNYIMAEKCYMSAIKLSNQSDGHVAKAQHELVVVRMKLGNYSGALDLARSNYELQRSNIFHIEAYFRCYIKSYNPQLNILNELLAEYNSIKTDNRNNTIYNTLKAELEYHKTKDVKLLYDALCDTIASAPNYIKYYPYRALKEVLQKRDSLQMLSDIDKKYCRILRNSHDN